MTDEEFKDCTGEWYDPEFCEESEGTKQSEDSEMDEARLMAMWGCLLHFVGLVFVLVLVVLACVLLNSCKSREVVVEKVDTVVHTVQSHDTLFRTAWSHDTLRLKDSVVVYVDQDGKEVVKYVWRDRDRAVWLHDTIYKTIVKADSTKVVAIDKEREEIEKNASWWTRLRARMGDYMIAGIVMGIIGLAVYLWRKFKG